MRITIGARIRTLASALTVAAGLLAVPAAAHASAAAGLAGYERQRLTWTTCAGIDDPSLQCATVRVPLDYTRPEGRAITVTISRLAASDPARRRGVLLTTGGGPGGPGVPLPPQLRAGLNLAEYDLVGFDIRFLERSTPITCGQPAEEPGGFWVRAAGYQSFKKTSAQAAALAADCARNAGWALPYATTANVARDMDVIRAVLGERKISYLGGSAAALVGVAYHTLFPDRVDRLVLDSPPNLDKVWRPFELDRTAAMEDNYHAFLSFVAAGDATYHLGGTPTAVDATFTDAMHRAMVTPIVAGDHGWTAGELGNLVVFATYFENLWPVVAIDFASILAGAAPPVPLPITPAALPGTPGVPADNHTVVNLAYRCGDHTWPRWPLSYRNSVAVYSARYPTYGPANANINPCAFWPVVGDRTPPLSANQPGKVLIVAATRDAAVPLANSVATHSAIGGSRLVTIDRRAHVPLLSGQANACMAGVVTAYLGDGVLPDADLAC